MAPRFHRSLIELDPVGPATTLAQDLDLLFR